jgi:hypothetical protein
MKWNFIRKVDNFDIALEGWMIHHLPFYSPDLYYHMDLDRKKKCFNIRDTITNKIITQVPVDLMTFDDKKLLPKYTINRTQWIDNRRIRIVNTDGFEKIVDFTDNFKQLKSNTIPLFTDIGKEEFEVMPVLFERRAVDIFDTEEWLLRKYQLY